MVQVKRAPSLSPAVLHHVSFPGESAGYRAARSALLDEEMELRRLTERIAAQRRALPAGGAIPEDYQFDGESGPVKLSALFAPGKDTLAVYSFMYGPERERPCPGCTHLLDALDGEAEQIPQRINLAVAAKSPLSRIMDFAKERSWRRLNNAASDTSPCHARRASNPRSTTARRRRARCADPDPDRPSPASSRPPRTVSPYRRRV
jgi:predicted dithiol-disulfide oxidoreductase (DUF899 family)